MGQFQKLDLDKQMDHWLPPVGDTRFRLWCAESIPDLSVLWARDHTHDYPPHMHDCAELVWIHSGRTKIICRGASYQLRAGDFCMFAPNELHSTHVPHRGKCSFTLLHVPNHLYWAMARERSRTGASLVPAPVKILRAQALGVELDTLLDTLIQSDDDAQRLGTISSLLEKAMAAPHCFAAVRAENAFWHPAVIHARKVMSGGLEEGVNINDMADEVGLNVRYFISLFKDGTGLPPHQYQIAMRVERARSLIQGQIAPLCDVAASTGFSDQSHLNRHFKRSYGFTPGAFREKLRPIDLIP